MPINASAAEANPGGGVVLLHGIARSSRAFGRLERTLTEAGFAVLNLDYPSRRARIEDLAETIHEAIDGFAATVPGEMHFVAHSMGGLLARVYLARHRPPRLGRVVMLGTPNGGSEIADLLRNFPPFGAFFGPAGPQLCTPQHGGGRWPASDYPVGIIAGRRAIDPFGYLVLPRPNDGRVSVANTRIDGMADHIVIDAAHPWLMTNREAVRQTLSFLRRGRFSRA
ncbi:triacylglycerol lipase [Bradyrhizobium sp. WD16]|uniref:esterase/lipase family protein n=1 Tax=Bradyrhizobium sp. WD16 TaxID=1521768 RepID=UPI0020A29DC5|nr:alpha/beta fold hydrolase [Bradyrhizobium sp. WD16]UTD29366.1 alpha/beta hydrolase [Bradyrhizobium sp. WD16]